MNSPANDPHRSSTFAEVPGLAEAMTQAVKRAIGTANYDGSNAFYDGKRLHVSLGSNVARPAFPGISTHYERFVLAGVRLCHRLGIKGANKRWKLETLERKIAHERVRMIEDIRRRKLPGCNLAGTWGPDALRRKAH